MTEFKLCSELKGHSAQVRGICSLSSHDGGVVTASIDKTIKIWIPKKRENEKDALEYEDVKTLVGHTNFIVDVQFVTSKNYPSGLIYSASHDKSVRVWDVEKAKEIAILENCHSAAVSCLYVASDGSFITGGWDQVAKIWNKDGKCVSTLKGHTSNVLCVLGLKNGNYVTGSGDTTIKIWDVTGKCLVTCKGHTAPVRDLIEVEGLGFMSVGNDGEIRLWSLDGECLNVIQAHSNLIYSIVQLSTGEYATSSEDKTVKIWSRDGKCIQTIEHPECVWQVVELPNGDIATACADNIARVFSRKKERIAPDNVLKAYDELIKQSKNKKMTGGVDISKLPKLEELKKPGTKDGETKLINNNGVGEVYQWSASDKKWQKIGDIVDAPTGGQNQQGGNILNGVAYDRVFDIETPDHRKLKIGYNLTENPFAAAQRFCWENNLPNYYVEEIGNFILQNTPDIGLGDDVQNPYVEGRYVPDRRPQQQIKPEDLRGVDPFTGGQAYRPTYEEPKKPSEDVAVSGYAKELLEEKQQMEKKHFPGEYILYTAANYKGILSKVLQFNQEIAKDSIIGALAMNDSELATFKDMMTVLQTKQSNQAFKDKKHYEIINKCLKWPSKKVFPIIDVLRLLILNDSAAEHYASDKDFVLNLLRMCYDKDLTTPPLQMLSLRFVANMFREQKLRYSAVKHAKPILDTITVCKGSPNKDIRSHYASVLQNYAVYFSGIRQEDSLKSALLAEIYNFLTKESEANTIYTLLVAAGTMVIKDVECKKKAVELGFGNLMKTYSNHSTIKARAAAIQFNKLLS